MYCAVTRETSDAVRTDRLYIPGCGVFLNQNSRIAMDDLLYHLGKAVYVDRKC